MVTGKSPSDPGFRKEHAEFLRRFSEALGRRRSEAAGTPA
jgi:hypothetical protein